MKRIILPLIIITMLSVGCQQVIETPQINEKERFAGMTGNISIITDKETGCKYIRERYGQGVGLTELLKSDGTPDCE